MWEFVKYCFYCFLMVISASLGYNPNGVTFKPIATGMITLCVLAGLALGILWLIGVIVNYFRNN